MLVNDAIGNLVGSLLGNILGQNWGSLRGAISYADYVVVGFAVAALGYWFVRRSAVTSCTACAF